MPRAEQALCACWVAAALLAALPRALKGQRCIDGRSGTGTRPSLASSYKCREAAEGGRDPRGLESCAWGCHHCRLLCLSSDGVQVNGCAFCVLFSLSAAISLNCSHYCMLLARVTRARSLRKACYTTSLKTPGSLCKIIPAMDEERAQEAAVGSTMYF